MRMIVNLYVEASSSCPKKTFKRYSYILETDQKGMPVTVTGSGSGILTYHQATLNALCAALERLSKPCDLIIYVPDHFTQNALKWLPEIAKRGYRTAKGTEAKNKELLHAILKALKNHSFRTISGTHTYSKWLLVEMRKAENNAEVGRM